MPDIEGTYYGYVIDEAGNIGTKSTASYNATSMANIVLATSTTASPEGTVTIVSTGSTASQVWLAPTGTTVFSQYTNQTKAVSGTATTIIAPELAGTYFIYVIDAAGNVSSKSTASVVVS
jgi:cytochrome c oxidase assembly protein Cox11